MNNETSRNQEQLMAMNAIYAFLTYLDMKEAIDVEAIVASACALPYEKSPLFVKAATISSIKNYAAIVGAFQPKMNKWTFDRLNRVEQSILILAYSHFFYVDEKVDKPIVIDVAVRQAKGYLDDGDYKFVNAILDKVLVRG
jgi:transcription antitermination protein NusB